MRAALLWTVVRGVFSTLYPVWLQRLIIAHSRHDLPCRGASTEHPTLFVDVTNIARHDAGTGIQRVVRSITGALILDPNGWTVQPIRYVDGAYRHSLWPSSDAEPGEVMDLRVGDVFLGLDLSFDAVRRQAAMLLARRRTGARIWFVMYDLLPVSDPGFFSSKVVARFDRWLIATARVADGYACISQATAADLRMIMCKRFRIDRAPIISVIPMGVDPTPAGSPERHRAHVRDAGGPSVLAVGTIEPRKGYSDVLDAFDLLWARGHNVSLAIVGSPGWKTGTLQRRIKRHPEFGRRLSWSATTDDTNLVAMYEDATLLIAASYREGFGLPILEATQRSCAVLARDIPVFRENAHLGLRYFPADAGADELAASILSALDCQTSPATANVLPSLASWPDTAKALIGLLEKDRHQPMQIAS
ncbi:glycosyltransferase family 4 protein [Sphingomonas glacialis]|nr:glycosyltransferase family 1 protein [Sphingomonas glacialis]